MIKNYCKIKFMNQLARIRRTANLLRVKPTFNRFQNNKRVFSAATTCKRTVTKNTIMNDINKKLSVLKNTPTNYKKYIDQNHYTFNSGIEDLVKVNNIHFVIRDFFEKTVKSNLPISEKLYILNSLQKELANIQNKNYRDYRQQFVQLVMMYAKVNEIHEYLKKIDYKWTNGDIFTFHRFEEDRMDIMIRHGLDIHAVNEKEENVIFNIDAHLARRYLSPQLRNELEKKKFYFISKGVKVIKINSDGRSVKEFAQFYDDLVTL